MATPHSCPFLVKHLTSCIPVIGGVLFVFVVITLLQTSFTDPGILPRATPEEAADIEKQIGEIMGSIGHDCALAHTYDLTAMYVVCLPFDRNSSITSQLFITVKVGNDYNLTFVFFTFACLPPERKPLA